MEGALPLPDGAMRGQVALVRGEGDAAVRPPRLAGGRKNETGRAKPGPRVVKQERTEVVGLGRGPWCRPGVDRRGRRDGHPVGAVPREAVGVSSAGQITPSLLVGPGVAGGVGRVDVHVAVTGAATPNHGTRPSIHRTVPVIAISLTCTRSFSSSWS